MKRRSPLLKEKPALELIEETFHLLRLAPARVFLCYYAGTLPFVLAFLYFWADMSRSAFAADRLPAAALGLSVLYLWMKTWHVLYARELSARLAHEATSPCSLRQWLQICRGQAALQSFGLFLLPLSFLLLFPVAWVYAFFQNVTVLGGDAQNVRTLFQRAYRQAALWPKQNHIALAAWKGFALFVVANLLAMVFVIPLLLRILFGFENAFTRLMQNEATLFTTLFNTTSLTVVAGLAYLCLDPMLKAFYVCRCFYGESLRTGHDIKTELKALTAARADLGGHNVLARPGGTLLVLLWMFMAAVPGAAARSTQLETYREAISAGEAHGPRRLRRFNFGLPRGESSPNGVSTLKRPEGVTLSLSKGRGPPFAAATAGRPIAYDAARNRMETAKAQAAEPEQQTREITSPQLEQTIKKVMGGREYSWRLPRAKTADQSSESGLSKFLDSVATMIKDSTRWLMNGMGKIIRWLGRNRNPDLTEHSGSGGWTSSLQTLLLTLSAISVGLMLFLLVRFWRQKRPQKVVAQMIAPRPDLRDENVAADQLPEDDWRTLGNDLLNRGELRLALRAFYLASLAHLAQRNLLTIAQFKSNHDYERELQRRSHSLPTLAQLFRYNVSTFDRVWYGLHAVNRELVEEFAHNVERIRAGT